jgi:hypothetical protein
MRNQAMEREFAELERTIRALRQPPKLHADHLRRPSLLLRVSAIVSMLLFYRAIFMTHTFTLEMPAAPSPATGRTVPVLGNYGKNIFVTPAEKSSHDRAYGAVFLAAAVTAAGAFCSGLARGLAEVVPRRERPPAPGCALARPTAGAS